jgi:hypothetical protein
MGGIPSGSNWVGPLTWGEYGGGESFYQSGRKLYPLQRQMAEQIWLRDIHQLSDSGRSLDGTYQFAGEDQRAKGRLPTSSLSGWQVLVLLRGRQVLLGGCEDHRRTQTKRIEVKKKTTKHRIILIAILMSQAFVERPVTFSFYSLYSQAETLPRPTGKHFVGVTYLSYIDDGRKEIFDSNRESHREVTVKAWYPSIIGISFFCWAGR